MAENARLGGLLAGYLRRLGGAEAHTGAAAYYAALDQVASVSPSVAAAVIHEYRDQRKTLKLIASENYCSLATQLAHGNLFTDKYSEGYPGHRFYAGCDNVDAVEAEAAQLARELFGADHAYVQPHSGADANLVAFLAILSARVERPLLDQMGEKDPSRVAREAWQKVREAFTGQKLLALDYYSGGHLTHGYRHNVSSRLFDAYSYSVDPVTYRLDLDKLRAQVREVRPLVLLTGYSAYPRLINFAKLREMADEVGAVFMVDMAHFAGLVAGKVMTGDYDPVAHAHVVTSTTHKTLRGPRGGLVLCRKEFAEWVDKGCPLVLGGPLPHAMAAKAVAFREALRPEFRGYAARIVENSRALADGLQSEGLSVLTGGTDNHLMVVNVAATTSLTGRQAESALRECHLTLNRNSIPFDANGPWYTSGLRLGTPATTTLGMKPDDMKVIARLIARVLKSAQAKFIASGPNAGKKSQANYDLDPAVAVEVRAGVADLLKSYPLYPELDLDYLVSALPAEG